MSELDADAGLAGGEARTRVLSPAWRGVLLAWTAAVMLLCCSGSSSA